MSTLSPRPHGPCPTCPYRRDCPSGLWAEHEYDKLPDYDGTTPQQAMAGALAPFYCHSMPEHLCAGWVGCHDMRHNLGLRLASGVYGHQVDPAVYDYVSPVPLFATGAEAAEHGKRDIETPSPETIVKAGKLDRQIARRAAKEKEKP